MKLYKMSLGNTTLGIMAFTIITQRNKTRHKEPQHTNIQHNDTFRNRNKLPQLSHNAKCRYVECCGAKSTSNIDMI